MISKRISALTQRPKTSATSKWRAWNAAAISALSRKTNRKIDNSRRSVSRLKFIRAAARQTLHARPSRSFAENDGLFFAADDRPPRRRFQKSLPRHSSEAANVVRDEAARFSFNVIGVGRDGRRHSQSRRPRRALLHVRRVLRQMARCRAPLRQERRAAPG